MPEYNSHPVETVSQDQIEEDSIVRFLLKGNNDSREEAETRSYVRELREEANADKAAADKYAELVLKAKDFEAVET